MKRAFYADVVFLCKTPNMSSEAWVRAGISIGFDDGYDSAIRLLYVILFLMHGAESACWTGFCTREFPTQLLVELTTVLTLVFFAATAAEESGYLSFYHTLSLNPEISSSLVFTSYQEPISLRIFRCRKVTPSMLMTT